ncbi:PREDICTED: disease resistance protein RPP13-like [Ipomoea nil]|uniref:disease resistance protein RPP13-like n=1 Tax=Ipomoea nil TaxID=35883 RepID=UPI0009014A72|nr:PREDICTED: disease resistance protein RPP13-like [Ipomoea nil]XP_019156823.1 PREDICTED: disease resistance protein RPP13-like [Ipomoea nil]
MACVAVLSLMRTMELEFLQTHPRPILQQNQLLIPPNIDFIQSLLGKLQSLVELFDENRMDGVEAIRILETRLRDVAFRTEDEIELQVVHLYQEEERATRGCSMLCQIVHRLKGNPREYNDDIVERTCPSLTLGYILQQAIDDIDAIKEELVKVKEEYELSKDLHGRNAALHVLPKPADDEVITMASHFQEIMVGKQDEFEFIKEKLIQHPSKQLEVVTIKGMGGIGKTTLAKKIYEDPLITSYFDMRAWTVASQHHSKRQMLLDLLGSKDDAGKSSDGDLALLLYQSFKKCQRYLVVMDDIWSVEAWYAVKSCFPDDGNGSRVLLTTRLSEVANHTCSKGDFSHQMQFLEQSEGWKLFNEKACKSRGAEFETIGRPVVEKCKGLPLAIIVVAGLFSKLNTLDEWISTANALSSSATTLDDEECLRILSLSYNHLPHNLKGCFLYLGVFPEDHEIHANNLARLWLAEGLVKTFENENFDAVANRYMQELMDRNLIILSQLCSRGRKIKSFRMHDLLHAFCVREAQKENLLHVVMSENRSDFPQKGVRWLRIQSVNLDMSTIYSQTKSSRSFFFFFVEEIIF